MYAIRSYYETAAAITERGGQARAIRCDVSDPAAAKQMVEQVEKEWGHIDVLVNGAGPYHRVNLFEETVEGWNEMFDGNLHPIFYLAQAVAPGMKANKSGRIINFSIRITSYNVCYTKLLRGQSRELFPTVTQSQRLCCDW